MAKTQLLFCATDNEIYEVLMASKQRISEGVLLELARDRGIYLSAKDSRETLADKLSSLQHDYNDLAIILDQREHSGRAEKTTSLTLNSSVTMDEFKEIAKEIMGQDTRDDKIIAHPVGNDHFVVQVNYSEIDHSKTRLIQRKKKEAEIEFSIQEGKTVVRMPYSSKAKDVFAELKAKLDEKKTVILSTTEIELSEFNHADQRTQFFTDLISGLKGFRLENVTSVRVEREKLEADLEAVEFDDDQDIAEAEQEALSLVRRVALSGESLLSSKEYQSLQKTGFFITSITWRARQIADPYTIVEFEAAFDEPIKGKGFKYAIRGGLKFHEGDYTKTLRPIEGKERERLLELVEQTATATVEKIRSATTIKTEDQK